MAGLLVTGTSCDAGKAPAVTGPARRGARRGLDVVPFGADAPRRPAAEAAS